jgi:DNA-binding protein HU-beta
MELGGARRGSTKPANRYATGIFGTSPARNPQFFASDHEKTPNFREQVMVRTAPNRIFDKRSGAFPNTQRHEEVSHMAKAAAGKQTTVTMRNLAAKLAEDHEMSKKQTEAVLGDLVDLVTKHLKKGDRIRIGGLGILQVRKRAARMGRNPATGEPIQIKASKKVAFRAAKELKEAV